MRRVARRSLVQRDFGNRAGRKLARMKYLVHDWGLPRFKAKVEDYLAADTLADPHPVDIHGYDDHLGWHPQGDGKPISESTWKTAASRTTEAFGFKSGLRRLFERFRMPARLIPQQSLLLCDLERSGRTRSWRCCARARHKTHEQISNARRFAMACPALPTCGLAITESERVMPSVVNELEVELATCPGAFAAVFPLHGRRRKVPTQHCGESLCAGVAGGSGADRSHEVEAFGSKRAREVFHVCRNHTCDTPATTAEALMERCGS